MTQGNWWKNTAKAVTVTSYGLLLNVGVQRDLTARGWKHIDVGVEPTGKADTIGLMIRKADDAGITIPQYGSGIRLIKVGLAKWLNDQKYAEGRWAAGWMASPDNPSEEVLYAEIPRRSVEPTVDSVDSSAALEG